MKPTRLDAGECQQGHFPSATNGSVDVATFNALWSKGHGDA
jgi:hypothetical protein